MFLKSENSCEICEFCIKTAVDYAQSIGRTSKTVDLGSLYSSDAMWGCILSNKSSRLAIDYVKGENVVEDLI